MDRPCIDPLDDECPKLAPNYFDRCVALKKFQEWNMAKSPEEKVQRTFISKKKNPPKSKKDAPTSIGGLNLLLVDPLCKQSKVERFQITLEKKELPKKANTDSIAETLLSDIFGKKRKKREDVTTTTEAPKGKKYDKVEDYYAYEEDSDYKVDSIGNSTKLGESSKSRKTHQGFQIRKEKAKGSCRHVLRRVRIKPFGVDAKESRSSWGVSLGKGDARLSRLWQSRIILLDNA